MRKNGVLLPIASIPSDYGIGGFSKEAYNYVDWLKKAGIGYWQLLPLGPTGYGDSPYQSFSTFAGNPYYIDLKTLIEEGLLTDAECETVDYGRDRRYIDYEKIFFSRFKVLRLAFSRSNFRETAEYKKFVSENEAWLDNYCTYMAIKDSYGGKSFFEWDEDIRLRRPEAVKEYSERLAEDIDFYRFQQYLFFSQWTALKSYANKNGIKIIGDIPIYVALDSADTWAEPDLFMLDEEHNPIEVAGCPPDAFSKTGQLWGNPLYAWDYHRSTGFKWWTRRVAQCFKLYDVVRVDHFRGFDEFYAITFGHKTAEHGVWRKGPGMDLFNALKSELGELDIIAEDLGFMTDSVLKLVADSGFPGMKVLQFAFDSREPSNYLPHNYDENCIVYTGTHDNDTTAGWYEALNPKDKAFSIEYMNNAFTPKNEISWDFIRMAYSSVAKLAVIPMQDFLGLGSEARTNTPSTLGTNWKWRMLKHETTDALAEKIYRMNWIYSRL